jgi:hypothetical protein
MRIAARLAVATALFGAVPLVSHCTNLSPLTAGVCGNGVVDPGEDCDGFADAGQLCGKADQGPLACRFDCAMNAACPVGYDCGVDEVCRQATGAFASLGSPLAVGAVSVTLADFNGDGFADALTSGATNAIGATHVLVDYLGGDGSSLGTFSLADKVIAPSVADVNGDGLPDVVAALHTGNVTGVTVLLGQHSNALALQSFPTTVVPSALLQPTGSTVRVVSFVGLPGGPVTVYFAGTTGGTYLPGLYLPASSGLPDLSVPPTTDSPNFLLLPEGPDQVVGDVLLTQVVSQVNSAGQACPALVYETQAGVVRVLTPCTVSGGQVSLALPPVLTSVTLPKGVSGCVDASSGQCGVGVRVGDVNGDGLPDLIVTGTATNAAAPAVLYGTYIAYGDGTGNFASDLGTKGTPGTTGPAYSVQLHAKNGALIPAPIQLGETYAAGDVNGDGTTDLVSKVTQYATPGGGPLSPGVTLLVSHVTDVNGLPTTTYGATVGQFPWQTAAIADFNGDGMLDVVGGSPSNPGIDFFSGTSLPNGMFVGHEFLVPTTGGVSHFAVGDFDGDGLADLAFGQVDPANDGSVDVSLSYGSSNGPTGAPLTIGRFASLAQITTAPPYPLLDLVAAPLGEAGSLAITRFTTGVGGRPPLSSQALSSGEADGTSATAVIAVAGTFEASAGDAGAPLQGIAALGQQTQTPDSLWYMPSISPPLGTGVAFGPLANSTSALPSNFNPKLAVGAVTNQALLVAAAPLGKAGYASLVAVAADSDSSSKTALLIAALSGGPPSTLTPTNVSSNGKLPDLQLTLPDGSTTYPSVAEDGQLALSDLDGDGYPDLVLLTGTASTPFCLTVDPLALPTNPTAPATSMARHLVVFWNDHNGGFSLGSPKVIATCVAAASCSGPNEDCPEAFATLSASGTARPTLAYVTHKGVYLAQFDGARHLPSPTALTASVTPSADAGTSDAAPYDAGSLLPANVDGYTGIGAGDINGDGVADLAVAARGSLYFFVGVAVRK